MRRRENRQNGRAWVPGNPKGKRSIRATKLNERSFEGRNSVSQERTKFPEKTNRRTTRAENTHISPYRATGNAQRQIGERFLRAWQGGGWPYSLHDFLGKMSQGLRKMAKMAEPGMA